MNETPLTGGTTPPVESQPCPPPADGARRIGVYVCHCGGNISDHVDVEQVIAVDRGRG